MDFFVNRYGVPAKKTDRDSAFITENFRERCVEKNIHRDYIPARTVERAIQTLQNLKTANSKEKEFTFIENVNRAVEAL